MSNTVIKVENLGKQYRLGEVGTGTLSHDLNRWWAKMRGRDDPFSKIGEVNDRTKKSTSDYAWALQNVNFEVKSGEVLGIIGRNGAGKSTLLKILSKVTKPTTGRILTKGRIASLLEVGTGFHPEMTGRENIFLNGAIMGMTRQEIRNKFDEIVDFAGVERYIHTPVKRYSSGMYVRLAFAVAAHLEPEILIVDEVLAVGDLEFQKKCLGKMQDVSKNEGRTVLFVSHNMSALLSLCPKSILLDSGSCLGYDDTEKIIARYLTSGKVSEGELCSVTPHRAGQKVKITKVKVMDQEGNASSEFDLRNSVFLEIEYDVLVAGKGYNVAFELISTTYGPIFSSALLDTDPSNFSNKTFSAGSYQAKITLPTHYLRGGEYLIKVTSTIPTVQTLDEFEGELYFTLVDTNSPVVKTTEGRSGCVLPILPWGNKLIK